MPANPKLYTDAACTTEVGKNGSGDYEIFIGSTKGLDGRLGDSVTQQFWVKNVGDEQYQGATVVENTDPNGYSKYSLDNITYAETVTLGDIDVNATKTFYAKVTVPAGATRGRYTVNIELDGETI